MTAPSCYGLLGHILCASIISIKGLSILAKTIGLIYQGRSFKSALPPHSTSPTLLALPAKLEKFGFKTAARGQQAEGSTTNCKKYDFTQRTDYINIMHVLCTILHFKYQFICILHKLFNLFMLQRACICDNCKNIIHTFILSKIIFIAAMTSSSVTVTTPSHS